MDKMLGGYQALQIRLLNGRIFQKILSKEPEAQYRSEQGKILTVLWQKRRWSSNCDRYRPCFRASQQYLDQHDQEIS